MVNGIEIVFEGTEKNKQLLKNCHGIQYAYKKNLLSLRFFYNYEFYKENLEECLTILNNNNIKYLQIEI